MAITQMCVIVEYTILLVTWAIYNTKFIEDISHADSRRPGHFDV